ncbi:Dehydrogenase OS=Streptomyces antimycoticus OX=68175 GN=SANT12839_056190 PE=3 SV=1 [Streptomyces antimycoticus]
MLLRHQRHQPVGQQRPYDQVVPLLRAQLVAAALADLSRGKTLSIPDPRYKTLMGAAKLVPRGLLGGLTSRTGRKYGPQ